jgi:FKBP-type peptidyl-prolyl cis-trans isomerase
MKKSFMFVAIAAMMFAGTVACSQEKVPYEGYQKTPNGLYYRFHQKNGGETPKKGELIEVTLSCVVNDTTSIIPAMDNVFQLIEPLYPGDVFEGLSMVHKGDSVSFIVNIDSTFRTFFGQPTLPQQFLPTDVMRFDFRVNDIYPESDYAKRMAVKNQKATAERVAKMIADHPEESAQAAQALTEYLAKKKIDVEPTESGLYYVMTQAGNGEKPEAGQLVHVHYRGTLLDGTQFDSSFDRNEPLQFPLGVGQVIPGWDEGIALMSKGEKGVLYIPYYLAYGDRNAGDVIKPYSNLIFEVELVDFEDMSR